MRLTTPFSLAGLTLACTFAVACGREEPQVPAATTETQASRQTSTPATVTGCLRAGDAANTYVLTSGATSVGGQPTTYQLANGTNVNLEEHVGKRVEVTGTVESQSQIATRE